jgi:hypothetical protein
MDNDDDLRRSLRRWHRREYLRRYEQECRHADKRAGARRIDVTLRGETLDDYAVVRRWIEGLNRFVVARNIELLKMHPVRLSDGEVIRIALRYAASAMHEDFEQAKFGKVRFLDDEDDVASQQ